MDHLSTRAQHVFRRIYYVKSHLLERMVDISEWENFREFKETLQLELHRTEYVVLGMERHFGAWQHPIFTFTDDPKTGLLEALFDQITETLPTPEVCRYRCSTYLNHLADIEYSAYHELESLQAQPEDSDPYQGELLQMKNAIDLAAKFDSFYHLNELHQKGKPGQRSQFSAV